MDSWTSEHRIQCQSCMAVIDVGIHLLVHSAAEPQHHRESVAQRTAGRLRLATNIHGVLLPTARPGGTGQFSTPLVAAIDFGQSSGDNVRHGGRHLRRESDTVTHLRGLDGEHHQPLGCAAERLT
jgi:hypothetical protein